jgi:hypothetical protein
LRAPTPNRRSWTSPGGRVLLLGLGAALLVASGLLLATGTVPTEDPGAVSGSRDEVALPDPGTTLDTGDAAARAGSDPLVTGPGPEDVLVECHLDARCERSRTVSSSGFPLEIAVLGETLVSVDGAEAYGQSPYGRLWNTSLMTERDARDPDRRRPTSMVTVGESVLAIASDGRLVRLDERGVVVASRDDPGPELELEDLKLTGAAEAPGRLLVSLASTLSPSLGQAEFAARARTAALVVALDPANLEVIDRTAAAPTALLVDGIPLLFDRAQGERALDPQELGRVLWEAETRRPGTGPQSLLDQVLTIDDRGLDLRDARDGTTTLRLEGHSWSIAEVGDGAVLTASDLESTAARAHGLGPRGERRWEFPLADPCCVRLVPAVTGVGGRHGVRLVADDGGSLLLDVLSGEVRAREPASDAPRPIAAGDGLEVIADAEGLVIVDPDGTRLATVTGDAIPIELPASFTRKLFRTIALRTDDTVIELVFRR